ncbi:MAG: EAL domain-containing protein [Acidimicrobiales bacterium]|nr:EAL domain-containing protein [Acidimicrobiales bacterium]
MLRLGGEAKRYATGFGALALTFVILPTTLATDVLYLLAPASATGAIVWGLRRHRPHRRTPWVALAIGLGAMLVGELVWLVLDQLGRDPFPSIADPIFLSAYPAFAVAVVVFVRDRSRLSDDHVLLDAAVVAAAGGLLAWALLMEPYATNPDLSWAEKAWALAYPVADVLLFGVVTRLLFGLRARSRSLWVIGAGFMVLMVSDSLYGWQELEGTYSPGGVTDLAMMVAYGLLGLAALDPSMAESPEATRAAAPVGPVGPGRLIVLTGSALVPPALLIALLSQRSTSIEQHRATLLVGATAAAVAFCLALTRLWVLVAAVRQLTEEHGERRFAALVENSADVIAVVDAHRMVHYASPALQRILGVAPHEVIGRPAASLVHPDDIAAFETYLHGALDVGTGSSDELCVRAMRADGAVRDLDVVVANLLDDPTIGGLVITLHDVTDERALRDELAHQAFHDRLTGLANRALFADRLEHALRRRHGSPVAVLFIDLDDFKSVNDGMGHGAGDELLVSVADRIRRCIRHGDTAARFGGDEFAVLLEDEPAEHADNERGSDQARAVAERVLELLALPLAVGTMQLAVGASIGIAMANPLSTRESLLQEADIAMYQAKRAGKSRVVQFDDAMRDHASSRLTMRSELARAINDGELRLDYQPIVRLATGAMSGAEALLRWEHPQRGLVPPSDFIPLAEETGLITGLGRWVLEEACREAASWPASADGPSVSVNASGHQFATLSFVDDVRSALTRSGLAPARLTIEITETVLMADTHTTTRILDDLRTLGVRIAIDDFGTGYCSLAYLQRFPVDMVKIDRAFIAELGGREGGVTLAETILQMAASLSVASVAEGIERPDQLDRLRELGCEYGQGFGLGRPVPAEEFRRSFVGDRGPGGAELVTHPRR